MMQGVLFDMDGVLFDTERISLSVFRSVAAEMGLAVREEWWASLCAVDYETYRASMLEEYGEMFDLTRFDAERAKRFQRAIQTSGLPMKPRLDTLLPRLRQAGYLMAVVSSARRDTVMVRLHRAGIDHYFDAVLGGDYVARNKPAPDIYLAAAQALRLAPSDCFAVEDSRSGIRSAYEAGCVVIMLHDLTPPDDDLRAMTAGVAEDLSELPGFLAAYAPPAQKTGDTQGNARGRIRFGEGEKSQCTVEKNG
jgi:HAD superfamily hydrolase (TIGR01509 family)